MSTSATTVSDDAFTRVQQAVREAATSPHNSRRDPTSAQAEAGNYRKARVTIHGLPINVENALHSVRSGTSEDGRDWSNRMAAHYGEFAGTVGADGDPVDVFIGHFPESTAVWIINQGWPDGGFDEHKVMLAFATEDQARNAYLGSFDRGWQGLQSISLTTVEQLRWWLAHGDKSRPFSIDQLPFLDGANTMTKILWNSDAQPLNVPMHKLMYDIRAEDAAAGLVLDSLTLAELMADPDIEALPAPMLDALVVPVAKMAQRMDLLQRVMDAAGGDVKVSDYKISDPVKLRGVLQVAVLFALTDGQAVTIWFHNPDTTPAKLTPMDDLVSWKWMLNKKDITIVVAPERGRELNPREVARRIMRLAERNSAAFQKANGKLAERTAALAALDTEITGLQTRLTEVQGSIATLKLQKEVGEADTAARLLDPTTPEGYAAIRGDEAKLLAAQDALDAMFQERLIEFRNTLRTLGWDGEAYQPLAKGDIKLSPHISSAGSSNVVGIVYYGKTSMGSVVAQCTDDLVLSPSDQATKFNADVDEAIASENAKNAAAEAAAVAAAAAEAAAKAKASDTERVDAAYLFVDATDAFKSYVAESLDDIDYSPFVSAKAMDAAAKAQGASISWDMGLSMMDSASDASAEDEDDTDAEAEWEATPEDDADKVLDGDFTGHPFRGNQFAAGSHSSGAAVHASKKAKHAERHGDAKAQTRAHQSAHFSHKAAAIGATGKAKKYHETMAKFHGKRSGAKVLDSAAPVLDDAGGYTAVIGKISKGGNVLGRAVIADDGKAMVYVGEAGNQRVKFASGTVAMWSEDDAAEMVTSLLASTGAASDDDAEVVADITYQDMLIYSTTVNIGGETVQRWAVQIDENKGTTSRMGDLLFPTMVAAKAEVDRLVANAYRKAKIDAEEAAIAATKGADEFAGFMAGQPEMQRARAIESLNKQTRSNGEFMWRKDLVRKLVADGATVGEREGQPAIITASGSHFLQSQITKAGIDYAAFLIGGATPAEPNTSARDEAAAKWTRSTAAVREAWLIKVEGFTYDGKLTLTARGLTNREWAAIRPATQDKLIAADNNPQGATVPDAIDWMKADEVNNSLTDLALFGEVTINDVGSENVYFVKDGKPYFTKLLNTDDFTAGQVVDLGQFRPGNDELPAAEDAAPVETVAPAADASLLAEDAAPVAVVAADPAPLVDGERPADEPTPSVEDASVAADRGYLNSLVDGSGDLLAEDTFTKLEPMFAKYADGDMAALLEKAATAYGDAAMELAKKTLAA